MAKTYTAAGSATAGDVYTASAHNVIITDVNNLIVPAACILTATGISVGSGGVTFGDGGTGGTWTEEVDTDAMRNPSSNPARITITTPGIYVITANLTSSSGVSERNVQISKNGTTTLAIQTVAVGSSYFAETSASACANLADGDWLTMTAFSVTTRTYAARFSAVWVGRTS